MNNPLCTPKCRTQTRKVNDEFCGYCKRRMSGNLTLDDKLRYLSMDNDFFIRPTYLNEDKKEQWCMELETILQSPYREIRTIAGVISNVTNEHYEKVRAERESDVRREMVID